MYQPALTITMTTAKAALDAGLKAIADGQLEFDLAQLTDVDSAAVATLLAWQRAATKLGRTLVFHKLPQNLQTLAQLYGADALLMLAQSPQRHPGATPA
jgi:phospholipid transport system transporter-binding protein